jgi:hypothetical protein
MAPIGVGVDTALATLEHAKLTTGSAFAVITDFSGRTGLSSVFAFAVVLGTTALAAPAAVDALVITAGKAARAVELTDAADADLSGRAALGIEAARGMCATVVSVAEWIDAALLTSDLAFGTVELTDPGDASLTAGADLACLLVLTIAAGPAEELIAVGKDASTVAGEHCVGAAGDANALGAELSTLAGIPGLLSGTVAAGTTVLTVLGGVDAALLAQEGGFGACASAVDTLLTLLAGGEADATVLGIAAQLDAERAAELLSRRAELNTRAGDAGLCLGALTSAVTAVLGVELEGDALRPAECQSCRTEERVVVSADIGGRGLIVAGWEQ